MPTRHRPFATAAAPWAIALVGLLAALGAAPMAMESGQDHPAPSLDGYLLIFEGDADGDGDGTPETHILRYRDIAGNRIFSMTTKGRLWAWSMEEPGDGKDGERNYVIRDSNCDGTFDERYSLDEQFHVPDCLK